MTHTDQSSRVPFFAALCLFLSAVEYAIPKPLPFMRLGLANLPILISLAMMSKRDVAFLIVLKVLGQALISGTLFSYVFVFSAAGSFASGFAMLLLYALFHKTKLMSNIGLSLAGALANNAAQVAVARVMIFGTQTRYIAPLLFFTGLVTGLVLGIFVNIFCAKSAWYKRLLSEQ
ncbi:Gx transporter family protein, partial [Treponema socranskii]|uniref:Gx transporter family protein n=1 Tax=Treponema socranskii TaxID=53419 RepID=UPI00360F24CD